jgi:cell division protein FtsW
MGLVVNARTGLAQARQWLRHPMAPYFMLIGATALLVGIGLLEVYSASTTNNLVTGKPELGTIAKQAASAAIGVPLLIVAARLPVRVYRLMAYPLLIVTLILLVAVLAFGQVSTGGNQNWLVIGPLTLQPSEFAKFALVLWGADLLDRKAKRLTSWDHLIVPLLPMAGVIIGLVMLGGDMGTSMVIAAIAFSLLFVAGAPARLFTVLTGGAAGLATLAVLIRPSRVRRFTEFLSSTSADPTGTGYQAAQGFSALSSGGWFGVGLGASREKWGQLPEAQTDFIFAIIGEELGLFGALSVLALFVLVGYSGLRIALSAQDGFVRLASASVTGWLMAQTLINLGAVLGVLPIAGVPLPFVSYGGSSLLPSLAAVGMLLSFARTQYRLGPADEAAEPPADPSLDAARRPARRVSSDGPAPAKLGDRAPRARDRAAEKSGRPS